MSMRTHLAVAAGIVALVVTGCGGSQKSSGGQPQQGQPASSNKPANPNQPETNPAGDIPDNQAYVPYRLPTGGVTVKVPAGWGRTVTGGPGGFPGKLHPLPIE